MAQIKIKLNNLFYNPYLEIMRVIAQGTANYGWKISKILGRNQSTTAFQIGTLRRAGLLKKGKRLREQQYLIKWEALKAYDSKTYQYLAKVKK